MASSPPLTAPSLWTVGIPGVSPLGETGGVEGVVAEDGEDAVHALVHPLQTHRTHRELRVTLHAQTPSLHSPYSFHIAREAFTLSHNVVNIFLKLLTFKICIFLYKMENFTNVLHKQSGFGPYFKLC